MASYDVFLAICATARLRGSIPTNFPYFHVEFNMRGGFVHVIDDDAAWRVDFARDILVRCPPARPPAPTWNTSTSAVLSLKPPNVSHKKCSRQAENWTSVSPW